MAASVARYICNPGCGPEHAGELLADGGSTADYLAGGSLSEETGEYLPPSSPTDAASPDTYAAYARSTAVQPAYEHRGAHSETQTTPTACTYGYDPGVRTDSVASYAAVPGEQTDRSSQEGEEL